MEVSTTRNNRWLNQGREPSRAQWNLSERLPWRRDCPLHSCQHPNARMDKHLTKYTQEPPVKILKFLLIQISLRYELEWPFLCFTLWHRPSSSTCATEFLSEDLLWKTNARKNVAEWNISGHLLNTVGLFLKQWSRVDSKSCLVWWNKEKISPVSQVN